MSTMKRRLATLEQKMDPPAPVKWHRIRRYEDETDEQATAAYEAEHGPIDDGRVVMRVIINKPGCRPA
jgi:hypothetical protein